MVVKLRESVVAVPVAREPREAAPLLHGYGLPSTLGPTSRAGIEPRLWSIEDMVALMDEYAERHAPRLAIG
jgi:hypothetical protein